MECCHSFTTNLDSRPRPSHPQHGYRRGLFCILLLNINSHIPSAIWQNIIWSLRDCTAFDQQLALADEGYESSSDTINLPTPLRKTPRVHHVSSIEHTSFNPHPVTPQNMLQTLPRPVCRWLLLSSSDDGNTPGVTLTTPRATPASTPEYLEDEEEEEDFQMVTLNNDHWTNKEISDRTLCIHEHVLPHGLCLYPCPYENYQISLYIDSLDLSDISNFKDIMVMSSNEDMPALEDTPY